MNLVPYGQRPLCIDTLPNALSQYTYAGVARALAEYTTATTIHAASDNAANLNGF